MRFFTLIHSHRYGESVYLFQSKRELHVRDVETYVVDYDEHNDFESLEIYEEYPEMIQ